MAATREEFVIDDYKLAHEYLKSQFGRLWQRFSFFLSVQLALFGVLGALALKQGTLAAVPLICALGAAVSAVWYAVAAEDRYLVTVYRKRVAVAAKRISRITALEQSEYKREFVGIEAATGLVSPFEWYWKPLSVTRMPVWLATILFVVWAALLFRGQVWLEPFLPAPAAG